MLSQLTLPAAAEGQTQVPPPTLWGLGPVQLHDRYWAARGVQVVRQGRATDLAPGAEQYLLIDPRDLAMFRLRSLVDLLSWARPQVLFVRVRNLRDRQYRENVLTDDDGQLLRFQRTYGGVDARRARVALTRDPQIARLWQASPDIHTAWKRLRRQIRGQRREAISLQARLYDCSSPRELTEYVRDLIGYWRQPAATIHDIRKLAPNVWAHDRARVGADVAFVGPAWIGAGRALAGRRSVLGPAALWDDPGALPAAQRLSWGEIEPSRRAAARRAAPPQSTFYQRSKRVFDIAFALVALAMTLPLYPLVMLAIWLEDRRPFFFGHKRECLGGHTFTCWKFRSMRRDADKIKAELAGRNQADGPQFFIDADPRLTRVGRLIRKLNIDELPQFWNVLRGDMSVVGPRPSPYAENQYCPPWREARLSVRPGITGLWQVQRTRQKGLDFQEWIKYDLQYVERAGWRLDLFVIFKTILILLRGSGN